MVEDGHISNSYQYSSSNTYYLDDIGRKNDSSNNNDTCVVVVADRQQDESTGDESADDEISEHRNFNTTPNSIAPVSEAAANCVSGQPTAPPQTICEINNKISLHFEEMFSPESNGSSHVERSSSQTYYDVTKEGGGGGLPPPHVHYERSCPQEVHKTLIAFGILIFNFFLTTTSLAIIHDKVPKYGPLPDTILDRVPARDWALMVSEVLIIVTTSIMLLIIVLHKCRFIIFRRLFLLLSLLYLMRSITMFVTVLPVSSLTYKCSPQKNGTDPSEVLHRSVSLFFGMGLTINGRHIYCGDYMYSGHTTILVMSYLMISEYSSKRISWLHNVTWMMSLTGVLMVLLSHSHYTVDVIVGYFVTTRLFWMYHTCANNPMLKQRSTYNYLAREWWFFLFQYFECNVRGPLQPLEYR